MQDYKHIRYESERRKNDGKKSKKTSWVILVSLILLIVASRYVQKHPLVAQKIEKIIAEHKAVDEPTQKRFMFYDILARGEVIVSADIPVQLKENHIYIQLGAFQNDIDADNFEAKMRLLDLHPQVQSLSLPEKGGHWFIVRIGPIKDDDDMSMIKTQLTQNNVEYAVVSKND